MLKAVFLEIGPSIVFLASTPSGLVSRVPHFFITIASVWATAEIRLSLVVASTPTINSCSHVVNPTIWSVLLIIIRVVVTLIIRLITLVIWAVCSITVQITLVRIIITCSIVWLVIIVVVAIIIELGPMIYVIVIIVVIVLIRVVRISIIALPTPAIITLMLVSFE